MAVEVVGGADAQPEQQPVLIAEVVLVLAVEHDLVEVTALIVEEHDQHDLEEHVEVPTC